MRSSALLLIALTSAKAAFFGAPGGRGWRGGAGDGGGGGGGDYGDGYGGGDYGGGDYGGGDYGGGDGGDYGGDNDDNIYADYAQRQQDKAVDGGGGGKGWLLGGLMGFGVSHIYQGRVKTRLKRDGQRELKKAYSAMYQTQHENEELTRYIYQLQAEYQNKEVQREYDEFKAPDVDNDERISRAEFNMYVQTYLKNYPGIEPEDYPRFEDFDHDRDGYVGFQEYSDQMRLQVQQAEMKEMAREQQKALADLYGETQQRGANNFNDLYQRNY